MDSPGKAAVSELTSTLSRTGRRTVSIMTATLTPGHDLGTIRLIAEFRDLVEQRPALTIEQRRTLVEQATILVSDLYVHLPLKRAMHAVDPAQRLRLLEHRLDRLTDREFHTELLKIMAGMRDLHTNYFLPSPYAGRLAFIGVLLERFGDSDAPSYLVSKIFDHLVAEPTLAVGAEVTHWNGAPIELAVWRNAELEAGGNLPARKARGLESLTLRSLDASLPPDEDWVDLRYLVDGDPHEARLPWRVFDSVEEIISPDEPPSGLVAELTASPAHLIGLDVRTELIRRVKKLLFAPAAMAEAERVEHSTSAVPPPTEQQQAAGIIPTSRPDELLAKAVDTAHGTFGYLRIFTFFMRDGDIGAFVSEVARLIDDEFPPDGLIIDVRGNGGGYVIASEFLLQFLTPRRVVPEPTQFITTPRTLELCNAVPDMQPWAPSIAQAVETAAQYSTGIALSPPDIVNSVGQLYHGPVVLITDALCYSACDMFAAGFADHEIGTILGVDTNTGAGGANVLDHNRLLQIWTDGPLEPLPEGAQLRVSLRRTLRVGASAGQPVEDLGIRPDEIHAMTRDDLIEGNRDLLERAGEILARGAVRVFDVALTETDDAGTHIAVTARGLDTIDIYVAGRPHAAAVPAPDGTNTLTLQLDDADTGQIRLEGFADGRLVAARLLTRRQQ